MLHHVEINVGDLEKSSSFWGWFLAELGYAPFQRWDKGISYKKGETYIVFVQTEEKYRGTAFHRRRAGLNHLAFHAPSRIFVDEIAGKLSARKVLILYEDRYRKDNGEGFYGIYFEDPDRIKVELVV